MLTSYIFLRVLQIFLPSFPYLFLSFIRLPSHFTSILPDVTLVVVKITADLQTELSNRLKIFLKLGQKKKHIYDLHVISSLRETSFKLLTEY